MSSPSDARDTESAGGEAGEPRRRPRRGFLSTASARRTGIAAAVLAAASAATAFAFLAHPTRVLRVCADPNNLPFSNRSGQGFENRIASMIGRDLGMRVDYTWWAQRRGFVRETLKAHRCDVILGVPTSFELTATTRPYYRSSYVFVTRADRKLDLRSLDDPRLHDLRIGVQLVGDDGSNTPPVHALSKRGIVGNVHGYMVYGDYRQPNPPARILEAVARGDIDVAIVWGPLAGYFARRESTPLSIVPVSPQIDLPYMPMVFDISIGVRREDIALRETLQRELTERSAAIDSILDAYGVPRVDGAPAGP